MARVVVSPRQMTVATMAIGPAMGRPSYVAAQRGALRPVPPRLRFDRRRPSSLIQNGLMKLTVLVFHCKAQPTGGGGEFVRRFETRADFKAFLYTTNPAKTIVNFQAADGPSACSFGLLI